MGSLSRNIQTEDALRSAQSRAGMGAARQHCEAAAERISVRFGSRRVGTPEAWDL